MKEATGEVSNAVIIIMIVAALVAFFYTIIWPAIRSNMSANADCSKAICTGEPDADYMVDCHLPNRTETFKCVWKG